MDHEFAHNILEQLSAQVRSASDECVRHAAPMNTRFEHRSIALMSHGELQDEHQTLSMDVKAHTACTRRLECIQDELTQVASSLRDIIWARIQMDQAMRARRKALVLHRGLFRTPDEILAQILGEASGRNVADLIHVSLVCKRFRNVALSMPYLWTRITSRPPLDINQELLRRSGVCLLDVEVDDAKSSPKGLGDFMRFVVQHSDRWKSFTLVPQQHSLQVVLPYLRDLRVPKLEVFKLTPAVDIGRVTPFQEDHPRGSSNIFQAGAPRLRQLHLSLFSIRPTSFAKFIVSLTIRTEEWNMQETKPSMRWLMSELCDLPELEELNIDLSGVWSKEGEGDVWSVMTLPGLKKLHIKASGDLPFDDFFPRYWAFPGLESLVLHFGSPGYHSISVTNILRTFGMSHHMYPNLVFFKLIRATAIATSSIPIFGNEDEGIPELLSCMSHLRTAEFHGKVTSSTIKLFQGDIGNESRFSPVTFPSLERLVISNHNVQEVTLLNLLRSRIGTANATPIRELAVQPSQWRNFASNVQEASSGTCCILSWRDRG